MKSLIALALNLHRSGAPCGGMGKLCPFRPGHSRRGFPHRERCCSAAPRSRESCPRDARRQTCPRRPESRAGQSCFRPPRPVARRSSSIIAVRAQRAPIGPRPPWSSLDSVITPSSGSRHGPCSVAGHGTRNERPVRALRLCAPRWRGVATHAPRPRRPRPRCGVRARWARSIATARPGRDAARLRVAVPARSRPTPRESEK